MLTLKFSILLRFFSKYYGTFFFFLLVQIVDIPACEHAIFIDQMSASPVRVVSFHMVNVKA